MVLAHIIRLPYEENPFTARRLSVEPHLVIGRPTRYGFRPAVHSESMRRYSTPIVRLGVRDGIRNYLITAA
jgi:hypothetical protein